MAGEKIHVIPNPDGGWTVKKDGATRATGNYKTKKEALEKAKSLSSNSGGLVIEYSAKGQVQSITKSKQVEKDMSKVKIHVVPNADGGWTVRREGSDRAIGKYKTKPEAMERAKALSGNSDAHIVEHSAKGAIMGVSKSKKTETKKPADKKTVAKKATEKKPATKKTDAKKPVAKKATPKKKKCRAAIHTSDCGDWDERQEVKKKREVLAKLSDEEEVVMISGEPVVIKKSGRKVVIIR